MHNVFRTELETLVQKPSLAWETKDWQTLQEMGIESHQKEIVEMSRKASEVHMIEEELGKEGDRWLRQEMKYEAYQDTDMLVLVGTEGLQNHVESSMAVLDTLLVNKYLGRLKTPVLKQMELVTRLGDILEHWVDSQAKWVYPQNIFASDIKKQLRK